MTGTTTDQIAARLKLVDEHVRHENAHDLDAIMGTFGASAHYDDEPWGAHYVGRDEVRRFYQELLQAVPGLRIDIERTHASATAVVLEVTIRAQHLGAWRGLPATGAQIALPLCGIYTFDNDDRLAGERIYYDRATLLRQLGVFHEPDRAVGRITTLLTHPLTMAQVAMRKLFTPSSGRS
jgi:steroid delta-isomerase-like uncharacterized protein